MTARVARLSYFFPSHNEEANLAGLVDEALAALPDIADTFEIIACQRGEAATSSAATVGRAPSDTASTTSS